MRTTTNTNRLARLATCVAATVAITTACGGDDDTAGPRVLQGGAPGETSRVLDPDEAVEPFGPEHTDADIEWVHAMIAHHEQALRMTELVPERTSRDDVPLFAERIELTQQDEIDWMVAWLEARGEHHDDEHGSHGDHSEHGTHVDDDGELMPGMLTEDQFAQLEAASGEEFDRLFLELMYFHHWGALVMVEELLESGSGQQVDLWRLVNDIDADQRIEMSRIEEMLADLADVDAND